MPSESMDTPVLLIIFNRPETTRQVVNALRDIRPTKMFVVADGPRTDFGVDAERCRLTRDVINEIDWDCVITKNYSESNLGCGLCPSRGISWVFEQVEQCIILEDDCVPHPSFFRFCTELLAKYRLDTRIMMISGNHHLLRPVSIEDSYCFSRLTQTWGWATWKRAWDYYDYDMFLWPELKTTRWLERLWGKGKISRYWEGLYDLFYADQNKDYWDFQWMLSCWTQNALTIIPDRNLVSNVGFDSAGGTHFLADPPPVARLPVAEMSFPLQHPRLVLQNIAADDQLLRDVYNQIPLGKQLVGKACRIIRRMGRRLDMTLSGRART